MMDDVFPFFDRILRILFSVSLSGSCGGGKSRRSSGSRKGSS